MIQGENHRGIEAVKFSRFLFWSRHRGIKKNDVAENKREDVKNFEEQNEMSLQHKDECPTPIKTSVEAPISTDYPTGSFDLAWFPPGVGPLSYKICKR